MDCRQAADDRVVPNFDVPGESPIIRKHDGVADLTIVTDVAVSKEISPVADARLAPFGRAAIDGHELPEGVFLTDFQMSRLALILQILCLLADRAIGVELITRASCHRTAQGHVLLEPAVPSQGHSGRNDAIGSNDCAGVDFRLRIYDGGRVNLNIAH